MTVFLTVLGSLFTFILSIRYLFLMSIRLDSNIYKQLYRQCLASENWKIIFSDELSNDTELPMTFEALVWLKGFVAPIYVSQTERLMTAGWKGKETVANLYCLRWSYNSLAAKLRLYAKSSEVEIPVDVINDYSSINIGTIRRCDISAYVRCEELERDIELVLQGKLNKTSAIFYGSPGNGKTTYIKYLALKYNLPIKIIMLSPKLTNQEIVQTFGRIKDKCIVLLEDWDNYFNGRQCIIGSSEGNENVNFTFDSILNSLDGIYNDYKKVIFIMTANDLNKIDTSLKNRPSRFKFLKRFANPSIDERIQIVGEWGPGLVNMNLDQILRMKEFKERGLSLEESKRLLGVGVT